MADLDTFGITLGQIQQFMNPSLDVNGLQIGDLVSLNDVASMDARVGPTTLRLQLSMPFLGKDQLDGYRVFIGELSDPYMIIANGIPDHDGYCNIRVATTLPLNEEELNWDITIRHQRVDLSPDYAMSVLRDSVRSIKSKLRFEYQQMLTAIFGEMLWPRDRGGYYSGGPLEVPLTFYKATDVRVFSGVEFGYERRFTDAVELTPSAFTVTHDDDAKTSVLTLASVPVATLAVCVDYKHDLEPVPQTLVQTTMLMVRANILSHLASVRGNLDYDMIKQLQDEANSRIRDGIYEFDDIELYRETKIPRVRGYSSVPLIRG